MRRFRPTVTELRAPTFIHCQLSHPLVHLPWHCCGTAEITPETCTHATSAGEPVARLAALGGQAALHALLSTLLGNASLGGACA